MKVTVDTELCTAAGQCVLVAGKVFDQREEDGIVVLLQPEPPETEIEGVREAAMLCPTRAIEVAW
jgi:ferredoxin